MMMERYREASLFFALVWVVSLATLTANGCSGDEGVPGDSDGIVQAQPDTIPPAATTDLRLRAPTHRSLALVWTAPGDDGIIGTATRYDIRMSDCLIIDENWERATPVDSSSISAPQPFGNIETIVVKGLESSTRYYFALKTVDEVGNESGISNCATEQTLGETIPPSDVTDLVATAIGETSFELTWTAPGDDYWIGTASQYAIRYSNDPIIDEASWDAATPSTPTPQPKPAGETETMTVAGLVAKRNYFFGLKTCDEVENWSGLSNTAPGLAFDNLLWTYPVVVKKGEFAYISFRASSDYPTRVSLHDEYSTICGHNVMKDLVLETFPGGAHLIIYDFFDEDSQSYLPYDGYQLSLCYGSMWQMWLPLSFVE